MRFCYQPFLYYSRKKSQVRQLPPVLHTSIAKRSYHHQNLTTTKFALLMKHHSFILFTKNIFHCVIFKLCICWYPKWLRKTFRYYCAIISLNLSNEGLISGKKKIMMMIWPLRSARRHELQVIQIRFLHQESKYAQIMLTVTSKRQLIILFKRALDVTD